MVDIRVHIGTGGRINIPAEHRRALGLKEGTEVLVGIEDGGLRIQTRDAAIERVQRMLRNRLGEGRSLSEELIAERRAEEKREHG